MECANEILMSRNGKSAPSVDPGKFRAAIGAFATGVAVISTRNSDGCHGMAVNSLTSVSLDPCLILFCVKRTSATGKAIKAQGEFAVNLLGDHQQHLIKQFCANPNDRFAGVPVRMSDCGMPLLAGSLAHMCCAVETVHESGDHDIVIGRVRSIEDNAGDPLVFFRGGYGGYHAMVKPEQTVRRAAI